VDPAVLEGFERFTKCLEAIRAALEGKDVRQIDLADDLTGDRKHTKDTFWEVIGVLKGKRHWPTGPNTGQKRALVTEGPKVRRSPLLHWVSSDDAPTVAGAVVVGEVDDDEAPF